MTRESWKSRVGFVFAAVGSAVGLANIWKFPYIVGKNGGAAFVCVYLLSLLLIGFPTLVAEILIGRRTQKNPQGAMEELGGKSWGIIGGLTIATGFVVSSFYSVVAGWILGYLVEAVSGKLTTFPDTAASVVHFQELTHSALWAISFHFCFMALCVYILFRGVRKGIEKATSLLMPLLMIVLLCLVFKGLTLPNASKGLTFLLSPDWSLLTPTAIVIALGQSFFTLSIGQGTMITYGSYLSRNANLPTSCLPIALADTVISLLASIAVFTIVFSVGMEPSAGPGLLFHTLPYVFGQISGGYLAAIFFFCLVFMAALTSEISAMEPLIAYLVDNRRWKRQYAVLACGVGAFLLGIPSALSGYFLETLDFIATSVLIPLGGLFAVILVGWRWGIDKALSHMKEGAANLLERNRWIGYYFRFCLKYTSPILIVIVFLHALGVI